MPARGKQIGDIDRQWSVLSLLEWGEAYLRERGFDESRLHTELLLGRVLGLTRLQLYLQFDRPLAHQELGSFKSLFRRRLAREPLQYILGETEFMGLPIAVDRRVLIPRPETEILVEAAVATLKRQGAAPQPEVLEVGTGSGNIAVALGRFVPAARILSIDVSDEALEVAARNVAANGVKNVELRRGDIRAESFGPDRFDLIISNPPYIAREEVSSLQEEVRAYEPLIATTDGADGLSLFACIFTVAGASLRKGGWLFLEIGYGQGPAVLRLASAERISGGEFLPDYAGIPRVFRVQRSR